MEKLYDRIDWHNNTTPALNETNLNLMSKAIDDIDNRVVDIAGTVMETVPQIQEDLEETQELVEDAQALTTHPPIIGQNGNWWTWDTATDAYVDSGVDAGVSLAVGSTTTLPAGSDATVTNTGTATDPVLNFGIPRGPKGDNGVGISTGGTTGQVLKKKSGTNYDTEWGALATSKGSATKGVYFDANGAVQEMSYTVGKSVPSDAVFTDTNTKVTQTNTTGSADYRLVLSTNANDTTETNTARKSTNFKANPSTGVLSTPKVKISKSANALITGSGTAGSDKGSGVSPRYYPAKWTFNLGGNPNDGDIITIKIPVAGGTYSEWLSTDNGTTYHPIALNGKSRITSQYAVNTYLTLIYESSGVCTTYALAGADTVTDVTGTWRVINYYDSNTTYSSMSQSEATTGTATTGRLITAKVLNDTISNKSNGHTILNSSGSAMNQRGKLQFSGADVVDDGTNDKTIVTTIPQSMIGDAWVTSHAYAVGDYCIDGNKMYKCKTAHTSTASNRPPYASYWNATSVSKELGGSELIIDTGAQSLAFDSTNNRLYYLLNFAHSDYLSPAQIKAKYAYVILALFAGDNAQHLLGSSISRTADLSNTCSMFVSTFNIWTGGGFEKCFRSQYDGGSSYSGNFWLIDNDITQTTTKMRGVLTGILK